MSCAQLPHRETGQLVPIHTWVMSDMLDRLSLTRAVDYLVSKVHSQLRELVVHELNESLLVNGVRVFDPHEPVIDPGAKSTL